MKQILQNLKNGEITVAEVPSPQVKEGHLRIKSILSLISPGTEKMLLGFGRSNYLNKAKQQPDKVKQVLTKIKTDDRHYVRYIKFIINTFQIIILIKFSNDNYLVS